jgi:hypothetical protein
MYGGIAITMENRRQSHNEMQYLQRANLPILGNVNSNQLLGFSSKSTLTRISEIFSIASTKRNNSNIVNP